MINHGQLVLRQSSRTHPGTLVLISRHSLFHPTQPLSYEHRYIWVNIRVTGWVWFSGYERDRREGIWKLVIHCKLQLLIQLCIEWTFHMKLAYLNRLPKYTYIIEITTWLVYIKTSSILVIDQQMMSVLFLRMKPRAHWGPV